VEQKFWQLHVLFALTLEDAVKSGELEDRIQILDIVEIVSQAIE
jgi:hypothetical protein